MEDAFSNSAIGSVQGGLMWAFPPDPGGGSPAPAAEYRKIYRLRRLTDPRPEVHEPGPSVFYITKKNFDEIHSYLSNKMRELGCGTQRRERGIHPLDPEGTPT